MPTMTDLVERSGDLKGELLDFALSPRFARAFRQAQKQYFRMPGSDESGIVNCLDLKQPDFSWERDGEFLLRRYKASYFEQPVLPSVIPIGETLARTQMAASEPARPRPNYRPARRGKRGRSR